MQTDSVDRSRLICHFIEQFPQLTFSFVFPSRWNLGSKVRVEDHSNITMFNFIAYPIFKRKKEKKKSNTTPWYWLQTPRKNYQGQKFSLSLFLILKEHNCLVTHSVMTKNEKKRTPGILEVSKHNGEEKLCVPPMTMVWYCSKWNNTNTPPPPPPSKHLLRPHHAQVWVKVSDLTAI